MSLDAISAGEMGRECDWGYIYRAESAEEMEVIFYRFLERDVFVC